MCLDCCCYCDVYFFRKRRSKHGDNRIQTVLIVWIDKKVGCKNFRFSSLKWTLTPHRRRQRERNTMKRGHIHPDTPTSDSVALRYWIRWATHEFETDAVLHYLALSFSCLHLLRPIDLGLTNRWNRKNLWDSLCFFFIWIEQWTRMDGNSRNKSPSCEQAKKTQEPLFRNAINWFNKMKRLWNRERFVGVSISCSNKKKGLKAGRIERAIKKNLN